MAAAVTSIERKRDTFIRIEPPPNGAATHSVMGGRLGG